MTDYYDEILAEIRDLADKGENMEALYLVRKELKMPYIPSEYEESFIELERSIRAALAEKKEPKEESLDSILKKLHGNEASQIAAAEKLGQRNLRDCITEIREYLENEPCPEAAALIMEAIAEQEIREEFTLVSGGMVAEFYGDSLTPVVESKGFRRAWNRLNSWLESDNPAMLEMCRTMLSREVYMFLPLSYEAEEGDDLARRVLEQVSGLMDEGETFRQTMEKIKKN